MADFKLKEVNEDGEQVIEKSNYTYDFTDVAIKDSLQKLAKLKKELKAQLGVNKAEMENYLHFHPFLKDMKEEDLQYAFLYERSFATAKEAEKKIKEIEEAEAETLESVKAIEEQTGFKIEVDVQ